MMSRFILNFIALSPILIINVRRLGRGDRGMDWKKLLGSITESVDEELRLRNAYLVAENRILRQQITGRVQLTDSDRKALAEIGQKLGKKALAEIATVAKPDTILAWHRTCADQQCDSSQPPKSVGRPRIDKEIEDLVVRMARENRSWGYDRIVGALTNLGYRISDQTVGNILKRHSIPPAPERKTTVTWREFIRMPSGCAGGHRLLHQRDVELVWAADLFPPLLSSILVDSLSTSWGGSCINGGTRCMLVAPRSP